MGLGQLLGFGKDIATPVEAVGKALDGLFTSDEERAQAEAVMEKLRQQPGALQVELNKAEAGHRSVFVAGWRPGIGWVCAISLGLYYIPQFLVASYLWVTMCLEQQQLLDYPASTDGLMELVLAMLGMGAMRTVEKLNGRAK